jgi:hypothetical protein
LRVFAAMSDVPITHDRAPQEEPETDPDPAFAGQKPRLRPLTDREAFEELRRRQAERRRAM